jgi:hypothetical protein
MRIGLVLLPLLISALTSFGQTAPDAPGLEVVKFSWSKERINWEQNPFGGPNENFHEMQFRARSEKRVSDAKRSGNSAEVSKLEKDARADAAIIQAERQRKGPPRYTFLYRASVKNTSNKTIKEIDWDYIFLDAVNGSELGRRQFTSVENIVPGKTKDLAFMITTPPTQIVSAYALDKKERAAFNEQVLVVRIRYADGSVWQLP